MEGSRSRAFRISFLFPAIDRTNIPRYLQCTYCSFLFSLSVFSFSPFHSFLRILVPFLSWARFPAICLLCRLYLTATETMSTYPYHATHPHAYSPWFVEYLNVHEVSEKYHLFLPFTKSFDPRSRFECFFDENFRGRRSLARNILPLSG